MKKFTVLFIALLTIVGVVGAASVTAPTSIFGQNEAVIDQISAVVFPADTLTGVDSASLFTKVSLTPGYYYALQVVDSSGSADSVQFEVTGYSSDKSTIDSKKLIDTMAGTAALSYKTIDLPFGKTSFPKYATIKVKKWIATLVSKMKSVELIKYRVINVQLPWTVAK